jgi:hypothetical protein
LLDDSFLLECRTAEVEVIVDRLRTLGQDERIRLLCSCEKILSDKKLSADGVRRIASVKILVGLFPLSLRVLERLLNARSGQQAYEVHFTIFCFLDTLTVLAVPDGDKRRILEAVSEYLHSVSSETAHAAWMAGDLLGAHWQSSETLDILVSAMQTARYVAGRLGALKGLEECLRETTHSSRVGRRVLQVLQEVSHTDRSHRVRAYVSHALERAWR